MLVMRNAIPLQPPAPLLKAENCSELRHLIVNVKACESFYFIELGIHESRDYSSSSGL